MEVQVTKSVVLKLDGDEVKALIDILSVVNDEDIASESEQFFEELKEALRKKV